MSTESSERLPTPHENEIPVPLAWSAILGHGRGIALSLVGVQVFSSGLRLDMLLRAKRDLPDAARFLSALDRYTRSTTTDRLLLGAEFSDGGKVLTPPLLKEAGAYEMYIEGGSGSPRSVSARAYISPLPPPGPVKFYCEWRSVGLFETETEFDGSELHEARKSVRVLWSDTMTGEALEQEAAVQPGRSHVGWFESSIVNDPGTSHDDGVA